VRARRWIGLVVFTRSPPILPTPPSHGRFSIDSATYETHAPVWPDRDRLSWYGFKAPVVKGLDELIATVDVIAELNSMRNGGVGVETVLIRGNGSRAMELLTKRPWFHKEPEKE
jgi:hypothetical protein